MMNAATTRTGISCTPYNQVFAVQNNLIFDKTRIEQIFKTTYRYYYLRIEFVQSIIII